MTDCGGAARGSGGLSPRTAERKGRRGSAWVWAGALLAAVLGAVLWGTGSGQIGGNPVAGLSAREAVALANAWFARGAPVTSFITTEALFLKWPDGREARVSLPANETYVAVAPYVNQTHPCRVHYISSCRGELPNTPFAVTARTADGRVVFDGMVTSLANGFIELWLPRQLELILTVKAPDLGLAGERRISTRDGAPTCITDVRLQRAG